MAYDEGLATRIRDLVGDLPGMVEKKMFGGLAFLFQGNMSVGVHGDELIVRLDPAEIAVMDEPGVRMFEVGGRSMKGWVLVHPDVHAEDDDLRRWVDRGVAYAGSLPPK
ncbi:TfoX/Sxy family protein [Actinokineospora sp. HUAS TT18]|uniref:TfoX/Sxy family protein n=1 Tax=Actinokineospora sp. HUAS TT18 TaxID=3447451 RepID=UPI003F5228DA